MSRLPESAVSVWLDRHLQTLSLGEECEGYLLGRGASPALIEELGLREWAPSREPCPHPAFERRYGRYGDALGGYVVVPIRAPTGRLIGMEARSRHEKKIEEFRTPEAAWNPFLINAPGALVRMARGGSVWVVEGLYDLSALHWVIPSSDAVLATLRAGLSRSTVDYLARWCRNRVYMVYDNDATGRRATGGFVDAESGRSRPGALELLRRANVTAVDYPYRGKDPGEVWSKRGRAGLLQEFGGVLSL